MPTLAEQIIGNQQQAQSQMGHTVGDAMQAFHIAATADHARQELEMEQKNQDLNKAKWFSSQLDSLNRMPEGAMRDASIQAFGSQAKQIIPNMNVDIPKIMQKDPEMVQKMNGALQQYATGQHPDPGVLQQALSQSTPELHKYLEESASNISKENQARLSAAKFAGRNENMQDNATMSAVQHVHNDPLIKTLVGQDQSLFKARGVLAGDPNHRPSWIELDESMQDAAKVLNGGTVSSDMKLKQLQQSMFDKDTGHLRGYATSDPNQPASDAAVNFAKHFIDRLSGQIDIQLGQAASRRASGMGTKYFHNPSITAATTDAIKSYQNGSWRGDPAINPASPSGGGSAGAAPAGGGVLGFDQWKAQQGQAGN